MAFFSTAGLLLLSLFSCFIKADFLDLMLSFLVLMNYDSSRRFGGSSKILKYLMYGVGGSTLFDIVWLGIYTGGWSGRVAGFEANRESMEFVLILQYFSLVVKLAMLVFYYNFHKMLQHEEIRDP
mmetsp:Transcript_15171/g.12920  ORF Transcript_15171/g.12920 Transcript_15171/m.12920 type:complete len:125 (-) Transcript_15171:274-648(-)